jgi:TatD DNase family protein
LLQELQDARIGAVTIGTTVGTSRSAVAFAEAHPGVWATVGYHPEHFSSAHVYPGEEDKGEFDLAALEGLARSSKKVVAIGEIGLDFYRIDEGLDADAAKRKQVEGFEAQIGLAERLGLPVVVHCRDAFSELIRIIRARRDAGATNAYIIHCFTGTWADAEPLLALGCFLSFSGVVTFPPRKGTDPESHLARVVERAPADRILVETDAPFLAPVPHRGQRNRPVWVARIAESMAAARGEDVEAFCRHTVENTRKAFGLGA